VFSINCNADWDKWSEFDRKLYIASQAAIVADWTTTRYGAKYRNDLPQNLYETNKILGQHPSVDKVDLYFVIMLVSNYYIADAFDPSMRGFYLTARTVSHGTAAYHNTQLGWSLKF
jgi:hypothetical protein